MQFRTEIKITVPDEFKISYSDKIMLAGSCFTENIGNKFSDYFFTTMINPFGITYNPLSIKAVFERILENKKFDESELIEHNGLWHSFLHHSDFSGANMDNVLKKINYSLQNAHNFLKDADFLFLTFGTAWVYELKSNGQIVSNCHKLPTSNFERRLLTVDEITEAYEKLLQKLKQFNPDLKIFFTVSPVRHLKDGLTGNSVSKSVLLLSVNEIVKKTDSCMYFPSYEIIIDDLRDYRFYAKDLTHLNDTAVDYIWEKIIEGVFEKTTAEVYVTAVRLRKQINHRFFKPEKANLQKIRQKILQMTEEMQNKTAGFDFTAVDEYLKNLENYL